MHIIFASFISAHVPPRTLAATAAKAALTKLQAVESRGLTFPQLERSTRQMNPLNVQLVGDYVSRKNSSSQGQHTFPDSTPNPNPNPGKASLIGASWEQIIDAPAKISYDTVDSESIET
ncbi:hypothetical protein JB92DRAFT_2833729 [Gautieria morchelliformis]|nr:hypothetical protein JB92DRAFT_2833729 [Gautieria morchelliformis]